MDPARREPLQRLCIMVLLAAGLPAGWFLPETGLLGHVGEVVRVAGMLAVLGLPFAIWAVASPDAARRWDESGELTPVPLAVPITWCLLLAGSAWALARVEPSTTRADHVWLALLWCGWTGALGFAVASTVMYLRGRGQRESGQGAAPG